MPVGVYVDVEDGLATIDFVDKTKRGLGLTALLAAGGPEAIETMTRSGPRTLYRVPEDVARAAGLVDDGTTFVAPATGEPREGIEAPLNETVEIDLPGGSGDGLLPIIEQDPYMTTPLEPLKAWPDGEPSEEWKRSELDAYADAYGINTRDLPNKAATLAAITAAS